MIKIMGIVFTIIGSTCIGFYLSKALDYRLEELKQLKKMMILLRGEINYSLSTLPEALEDISAHISDPFKTFLSYVSKELKEYNGNNLQIIWGQGIEKHLEDTFLKKEDLDRLKQLGDTLGYLDKEMQVNTINMYIEQLEDNLKELKEHLKNNEKLYRNLGVLAGIFLAIVFI